MPGGIGEGGVGGDPGVTMMREPGVVVVSVTPWLVMVKLWPNRKFAVVAPSAVTDTVKMPPRMPMLADGVSTFTSDVLLITPPTKRMVPALHFQRHLACLRSRDYRCTCR